MVKSYYDEISSQIPAKESRPLTGEEQKVRDQENARYKEGKRQQRMDDLESLVSPIKAAGKDLKEKILGTEEQNRKGQETLDKQAKEGSRMAKMLGGKGMKSGGKVSSASSRADGCAVRGKTKGRIV